MNIQYGQNHTLDYKYIPNRPYHEIQDRFLRNTLMALDHLYKTNALTISFTDDGVCRTVDIIDKLVENTEDNIQIKFDTRNSYSPSTNTVTFYDTHGAMFRKNHKNSWFTPNRGYNSPMSLLAHELIHCYNELYETEDYLARKKDSSTRGVKIDNDGRDLSFPNAEERFVIRMTNQVVERLGEDKRNNYGRSYYPTENAITTEKLRHFADPRKLFRKAR